MFYCGAAMIPFALLFRELVTVFQKVLNADSTVWGGYTWVLTIPHTSLPPATLTRLTLNGPASGVTNIGAMYIGHKSGTYDFTSTPVPVTVGGNTSFVIPQGGQVVTDVISFNYDGVTDLCIAANLTGSSNIRLMTSGGQCSHYFKPASAEASTIDKSGYDAGSSNPNLCSILSGIEMV
jgi:hypothetical protein